MAIQFNDKQSLKAIETAYYGPTNFKGARIRVRAGGRNKFYSYEYEATDAHRAAVEKFCAELNWSGTLQEAGHPDDDGKRIFVFVD